MRQQISVVTLGVRDLARSRRFYRDGFEWKPVFQNDEIVFYQMNGFVLGTWLEAALARDSHRETQLRPGAFALAHNLATRDAVEPAIARLVQFGGKLLKAPVEPPHGGFAGYVADPDDHAWEIAWNPAWPIDANDFVSFAPG